VTDGFLVFWEVAHPDVLSDEQGLFDHTCFIACTNLLRPLGQHHVRVHPWPELADDEVGTWGGAVFTVDEMAGFKDGGYVLAEIRLPAQPMGMPVPEGAPERPAGPQGD
jgi:hypothetical protein